MRGIRQGETIIEIAKHNWSPKDGDARWGRWTSFGRTKHTQWKPFIKALEQVGNIIRFPGDPDQTQYEIKGFRITAQIAYKGTNSCLLYTSPSPRDLSTDRMPSSA